MAAMLTTRRALSSTPLQKLISPVRCLAAPSAFRSFNTNPQILDFEDERNTDIKRRADQSSAPRRSTDSSPSFFSDVFDPLFPSTSLRQMMNMMDQMMENPFSVMARGFGGGGARRGWGVKEDKDALHLRIDMPGLGKEDVRVSGEKDTLIIKGEGEKESESEESGRRYSSRIDLPPKLYKMDQIRAEMNNGVLKVLVPKVKEEERTDVFQVKIE